MKTTSFLIVDDNSVALRELADILKHLGYKALHETSTASEAWAMLRLKEFSCVISTWDMPEMSGLALLKVVRNDDRYASLPFFLSDSAFTKSKVINAGRAGVTGLIVSKGAAFEFEIAGINTVNATTISSFVGAEQARAQ